MNEKALKLARKSLAAENRKWPPIMQLVPREDWPEPHSGEEQLRVEVWRSRDFLAHVFDEGELKRLSICRAAIGYDGRWLDGITWEELQMVKNECGFLNNDAVEVFPAQKDVVDVANMRHLWVFPGLLDFPWRANQSPDHAFRRDIP